MLIEDRLPEGAALRVEALARTLDVSPTPIREALVQLEAAGLVVYAANRGYRVAPLPSARDMELIMDARTVLDVAAARRAADRADRAFVAELRACVDAQAAAAQRIEEDADASPTAGLRDYLRADHAFHDTIYRESGNPFLLHLAQALDAQSQRARQTFRRGVDDAPEAIAEHRAILEAVAAGDADAAEAATRAHLERVLTDALRDGG